MPKLKIVSGGQTGVDRAALDWAIARGVAHGGWCPQGRLAEDGPIASKYQLKATPSSEYAERTLWNVRDSDGTVIFSRLKELSGGSLMTEVFAQQLGKPCLHLTANASNPAKKLRSFVARHQIEVLNVAGPRASLEPDLGKFVQATLEEAFARSLDWSGGGRP